jgi:hypothetical protein
MRYRRRLQHPGRESRHKRLADGLLFSLLSRYDRKGGMRLVRLWREWAEVVGPDIASLARPVGHKDGALILAAEDSVAAQQLSFYAPELLARVNEFFGEEIFDKVRFELLDGRAPLDGFSALAGEPDTETRRTKPQRLPQVGGLVGQVDTESAVGRCYLAYVRRYQASREGTGADTDANTRPQRASRRIK